MSDDIFIHADRALMVIYNNMAREFQNLSTTLGFDELNVMETRRTVNAMYARMNQIILNSYADVAGKAYRDADDEVGVDDDFNPVAFVASIMSAYNPVSDFVYTREWTRKRDRLFESIIATERGNQEMRQNLKRGLDVLANQVRQYADMVTINARIRAFERAGVEYGRWVAEDDGKTCSVCRERNGTVYRLDELPIMPAHWHCRCQIEPATEEDFERQNAV